MRTGFLSTILIGLVLSGCSDESNFVEDNKVSDCMITDAVEFENTKFSNLIAEGYRMLENDDHLNAASKFQAAGEVQLFELPTIAHLPFYGKAMCATNNAKACNETVDRLAFIALLYSQDIQCGTGEAGSMQSNQSELERARELVCSEVSSFAPESKTFADRTVEAVKSCWASDENERFNNLIARFQP